MQPAKKYSLQIKSHKIILGKIREYQEISAAELSKITKYRRSTLVYILRTLDTEGFITVSRIGESTSLGGKPPVLWKLVPEKGFIIGLEIIPGQIRAVVINFASIIVYKKIIPVKKILNNEKDFTLIPEMIDSILNECRISRDSVIGVTIAIPGLVDHKRGDVYYSAVLEIKNLTLKSFLEDLIKLPVRILNDANAGALGIKWYQKTLKKLPPNIIFLTINQEFQGMGAGLILNNLLYEGAKGTAGEIFDSLPDIADLLIRGLNQFGETEFIKSNSEKLPALENITEYAAKNCRVSQFIIQSISETIEDKIIDFIELLNPNLIIIGGDINIAKEILLPMIIQNVNRKCHEIFPTSIFIPQILFSEFDLFSVSIGSTALLLEEVFA